MTTRQSHVFGVVTIFQFSYRNMMARKANWLGPLIFGACVLMLFPFAFGTELLKQSEIRYGSFWMINEFIVALVAARIFAAENESGILEFLIASPTPRTSIFLGKVLFTVLQLLSLQLPLVVLWVLIYNVPLPIVVETARKTLATCLVFNFGTASLGVILSCVTARSLAKDMLFPILFFPLQVTLLIAAVMLCLQGEGSLVVDAVSPAKWWSFLAGYPVVLMTIGLMLADHLFQE